MNYYAVFTMEESVLNQGRTIKYNGRILVLLGKIRFI